MTLGCRLNAFESEAVRGHAVAAGLHDAIIVNTCAVTGEAVRQAAQAIRRLRRENPAARMIVTGCAAQIDPARFSGMPEVDRVIGNAEKMRAETFQALGAGEGARMVVNDILSVRETAHALVDERPGRLPAVVLAPGEHADGLLRPDEIVDGRHPAALTVLAACRSAAGALEGGRALATLTGALLAAGSQAVVATLWDVDDTTTAAFMEQFYYEVGRGAGAAEALRRVKQRLSAEEPWRNPALWAGYVVIGDGSAPLVARGTPPLAGIGLAAAAMAALAWLLVARRSRA